MSVQTCNNFTTILLHTKNTDKNKIMFMKECVFSEELIRDEKKRRRAKDKTVVINNESNGLDS